MVTTGKHLARDPGMPEHPRPPVDNPSAHSTRLWAASLREMQGYAHRLPTSFALRA